MDSARTGTSGRRRGARAHDHGRLTGWLARVWHPSSSWNNVEVIAFGLRAAPFFVRDMDFWRFDRTGLDPSTLVVGAYDLRLVFVSFLVASVASYAALEPGGLHRAPLGGAVHPRHLRAMRG